MSIAKKEAEEFLYHQQAFRLGTLLTESSHPKTATLSQTIQHNMTEGIRMMLSVDEEIAPASAKIFASNQFSQLVVGMTRALNSGKKIFFTGCGATGRLSILLEAAWREFWQRADRDYPEHIEKVLNLEDHVISVMAGGDFALIKSVEGFEDFPQFGRHQLLEAGVAEVAGTSGGQVSSQHDLNCDNGTHGKSAWQLDGTRRNNKQETDRPWDSAHLKIIRIKLRRCLPTSTRNDGGNKTKQTSQQRDIFTSRYDTKKMGYIPSQELSNQNPNTSAREEC